MELDTTYQSDKLPYWLIFEFFAKAPAPRRVESKKVEKPFMFLIGIILSGESRTR